MDGLELWTEKTTVARLSLPTLPLREGRFVVEARLYDSAGAELPIGEPSVEIAVFAHEAGEEGPVRLGGSWEVGTRDPTQLAEAPEQ